MSRKQALSRASTVLTAISGFLLAAGGPLLTGCIVVGSSGCVEQAKFTRSGQASTPHVARTGLDVLSDNGAVTIASATGESVSVAYTIRAISQDRANATNVSLTRAEDGSLLVRINWPNGKRRGNEGCELNISVPETAWVRAITTNGAITCTGMEGTAELRATNGEITLANHSGPSKLRTTNGAIRSSAVSGDVQAETTNGSVDLSAIGGFVIAQTTNGDVAVKLAPDSKGPLKVTTTNGSVKVSLSGGFSGNLKVSTTNGGISLNVPQDVKVSGGKKEKKLEFGGDGDSSIRTVNGGISVSR